MILSTGPNRFPGGDPAAADSRPDGRTSAAGPVARRRVEPDRTGVLLVYGDIEVDADLLAVWRRPTGHTLSRTSHRERNLSIGGCIQYFDAAGPLPLVVVA